MQTNPPGMQASINRCLSQARINWEGYATGMASGVIWGGGLRVGAPLVLVGVASTGTVGASASIIFPGGRQWGGGAVSSDGMAPPGLSVPLPPLSSPAPQNPETFHDGMQ